MVLNRPDARRGGGSRRDEVQSTLVGEKVLPAGDALIVSYGAIGRDEQAHDAC
ncbi:hypothetical protein ABZZ79_06430 [Streptomyces sp. NPDC006458]|uniref:hypothetical protein n=1 Tax=Streptomyces sp. NPDC006458 TaxID=3154302 RepID=UPI0033A971C0